MPNKATEKAAMEKALETGTPTRANMTSRFVGMIVIPGNQIVEMKVEERTTLTSNQQAPRPNAK